MNAVINTLLIGKLTSISEDIKVYCNINAYIANNQDYDNMVVMSDEDVNDLLEIRNKIKSLSYRFADKLKQG